MPFWIITKYYAEAVEHVIIEVLHFVSGIKKEFQVAEILH